MEDQEMEDLQQVECIAAIQWNNNVLGAAYWTNSQLYLLSRQSCFEDQIDSMVSSLRLAVNPTCILIHSRTDPLVISAVEKEMEILNKCLVETRPVMDFKFDKGRQELSDLEISDPEFNPYLLESILEVNTNQLSVGCAGALLSNLWSKYGSTIATTVSLFSLADRMQISQETLYALHIFDTVYHPNVQCMKPKEGSSLFSQLNKTKTKQGQEKLKTWFFSPLQNVDKIAERQEISKV
jgi:DNA mismatch repair ATPase MutS